MELPLPKKSRDPKFCRSQILCYARYGDIHVVRSVRVVVPSLETYKFTGVDLFSAIESVYRISVRCST